MLQSEKKSSGQRTFRPISGNVKGATIAISAVPYDDGESDEYIPLEYAEVGAATWDDDEDDVRYIKDDDDLPF